MYRGHKIILPLKSVYFSDMLDPINNFRQAQTGIITFPEEDPHFVGALLEWCYGLGHRNLANTDNKRRPLFHA
ncbi:hypothetical protein BKA81DRAFT_402721 [Phyllosticta paracitricarpa]|uniref:BTB domain-containing protein n=2 Tax=Phyllosticta TaxID=121621 RepID=A0ABR1ML99_9PEZI